MRTGILTVCLALWSFGLIAQRARVDAASAARLRGTQSFIDTIALPPKKQDWLTKEAAAQSASSAVPTAESASLLALGAITDSKGPGLDMRELWTVTGLFRLGSTFPAFGVEGDLVWEVRINRSFAGTITRVLWVSTTTRAVRVLVPSLGSGSVWFAA